MALVLTTTLRMGDDKGKVKVVKEGTPYGKLTVKERVLAKELGLLGQAPEDPAALDAEIAATEVAEAEDSEEE